MSKIAELFVVIGAKLDNFNKGMSDAQKAMSGLGAAGEGISSKLGGLWKQFAFGQIAANVLTKGVGFLKNSLADSVKSAMESEDTQRALASALETTGRKVNAMLPGLIDFAKELQKQTIQSDEAALSALALLAQLTNLNEEGLKVAAQGAAGMATVFKMDLETAARNVAKAMEGNYTMMGRYIPQLKDAKTEGEKHAIVMQTMAEWYGRATDETTTFSGSLKQLGNMWDEVKEAVGRAVTENEAIKDLIARVKDGIVDLIESGKIADWADKAAGLLSTLVKTFETIIDVVGEATTGFQMLSGSMPGDKFLKMNKDLWEQIQAGKKAVDDFRESLKVLKPTEEELRTEIEKGPASWEKYKTGIKATDDQLATNKDTIVGWMGEKLRAIGLIKDATKATEEEKPVIETVTTRIKTFALEHRDLNDTIQAGINLQKQIAKDIEFYSETIIDTAIPASRDLGDAISQAAGTIPDIAEEAKTTTVETKGYFDGLYNNVAKGFGDAASGLIGEIFDGIDILHGKFWEGGLDFKRIFQDVWDTIKNAFFTMIGEMTADWVLDKFKKLFEEIKKSGSDAASGITGSMKDAASGITGSMKAAAGATAIAFLGAIGMIVGAFTAFIVLINALSTMKKLTAEDRKEFDKAYKEMQAAKGIIVPTELPKKRTAEETEVGGYQRGGIAWRPQLARVAEVEPEIIVPLRQYQRRLAGAYSKPDTGVGGSVVINYAPQISAMDSQDVYRFMATKGREALEKIIKENVRGITRIISAETGRY